LDRHSRASALLGEGLRDPKGIAELVALDHAAAQWVALVCLSLGELLDAVMSAIRRRIVAGCWSLREASHYDVATMMVRTQIALEAQDHRRAKRRAAELGVSLAEYVRGAVRRDLGDSRAGGDISGIFGLFDSGGSDIATHKDRYLAEAIEAEHPRDDVDG
jgi:hypothetical protein